jgi:hypothetical protein
VQLTIAPCRQLCDWGRTKASTPDGRTLLACRGCGAQWVRGEPWTPAQADGSRPQAVLEELRRPEDAAGSAGS